MDLARRLVSLDGESVRLSRKEFGVLSMLVRHSGRVVTQQQLLRELWGPDHVEDTHYLRIVVAKIRQKLGDEHAHPRYVQTEAGVGIGSWGSRAPPEASILPERRGKGAYLSV